MKKAELLKRLEHLPNTADIEIAIRASKGYTIKIRKIVGVRRIRDQQPRRYIARLVCCERLYDEVEQLARIDEERKSQEQREKRWRQARTKKANYDAIELEATTADGQASQSKRSKGSKANQSNPQ